jgi:hypothetical protein
MQNDVERLRREFGGTALQDALIDRYEDIQADISVWRSNISVHGLIFGMTNGAVMSHPLVDRVLKAQNLLIVILREILRVARTQKKDEATIDEFDEFLRNLEDTSRPHQTRHRGHDK